MDAKTIHDLVFLAVLSMFCSGFAWAVGAVVKRRGCVAAATITLT
jgi:hypothetical protein